MLPVGETGLLLTPLPTGDAEICVSPDPMPSWAKGTLVSLVSLANTPFFGSHWKYLILPTEPSFLPENQKHRNALNADRKKTKK